MVFIIKNKKIIIAIILLIAIVTTGGIVNATVINKKAAVKTVVLDTIKEKDYLGNGFYVEIKLGT